MMVVVKQMVFRFFITILLLTKFYNLSLVLKFEHLCNANYMI